MPQSRLALTGPIDGLEYDHQNCLASTPLSALRPSLDRAKTALWGIFLQLEPKGRSMTATISDTANQRDFYRRWLMGRASSDLKEFGVETEREDFIDHMVSDFNSIYRTMWTIDELCLHPREAMGFCAG
jgi:hypothetical protein